MWRNKLGVGQVNGSDRNVRTNMLTNNFSPGFFLGATCLKRTSFSAFLGYNWDVDLHENLMDPFRSAVERRATGTYCGTKYKLLADPLEKSIKNADLS